MDNLKAYKQVIDNLVYHALNIIGQALQEAPQTAIIDIITARQSKQWDKLDEIVYVCSITYSVAIAKIITDYTANLATTMTRELADQV